MFLSYLVFDLTSSNSTQYFSKFCTDSYLLYVRKVPEASNFTLSINSNYTGGCVINGNSFNSFCKQQNIGDCSSCKIIGCTVVECGSQIPVTQIAAGNVNNNSISLNIPSPVNSSNHQICAPYNATQEELDSQCQVFEGVKGFSKISICTWENLQGYSKFSIFLVTIVVIIGVVFSLSIIYYNIYVHYLLSFISIKVLHFKYLDLCLNSSFQNRIQAKIIQKWTI